MAPEYFTFQCYDGSVDFWSVGVLLFEMLTQVRPFRTKQRRELIKSGKYKIPDSVSVSAECVSALNGFLHVVAKQRFGYSQLGIDKLISHPFFKSVVWSKLHLKAVKAPFIPDQTKNYDPVAEVPNIGSTKYISTSIFPKKILRCFDEFKVIIVD